MKFTKLSPKPKGVGLCEGVLTAEAQRREVTQRFMTYSLRSISTSLRGVISDVVDNMTTWQSPPNEMRTWNRQSRGQCLTGKFSVVWGLLRALTQATASARNDENPITSLPEVIPTSRDTTTKQSPPNEMRT